VLSFTELSDDPWNIFCDAVVGVIILSFKLRIKFNIIHKLSKLILQGNICAWS